MDKPADMVKDAMDAGKTDSKDGIPWIKEKFSFSMKSQTFGRLKKFLADRDKPQVRARPKRGPYKPKTNPQFEKLLRLGETLKELLREFSLIEIEMMLSILNDKN